MNQISDERRAELQKIRNCLPFMTPEAGLSETTQAFDELIGAYTELVDLREEYNASLAAICDLAHALGFDPDVWDHESCPNNSEMVHELIGHVGLMIAKELAADAFYDPPATAPFRTLATEALIKNGESKEPKPDAFSKANAVPDISEPYPTGVVIDPTDEDDPSDHPDAGGRSYLGRCMGCGGRCLGNICRECHESRQANAGDASPYLAPAIEAAAAKITSEAIKAINRRIAMARLENIKSLEDPGL